MTSTVIDADNLGGGLICGYRSQGGRPVPVGWSDMEAALGDESAAVWLHFNLVDMRCRQWLQTSSLPAEVRDFLLERDARVRLEPLQGGIVGALPDTRIDGADLGETGVLRFYLDRRVFISVRSNPLLSVDRLRRTISAGSRFETAGGLLALLLDQFRQTFSDIRIALEHRLDEVEDSILGDRFSENGGELGHVRRALVQLRRLVGPQRHALAGLLSRLPGWVGKDEAADIRQALEALTGQAQEIEHLQESGRLLQDELASRLGEATNRNLYFLSIATAVFLPMTLITGVFGMNVAGLPGLQGGAAFWWVMLGMAATCAVSLFFLRWKRLI